MLSSAGMPLFSLSWPSHRPPHDHFLVTRHDSPDRRCTPPAAFTANADAQDARRAESGRCFVPSTRVKPAFSELRMEAVFHILQSM